MGKFWSSKRYTGKSGECTPGFMAWRNMKNRCLNPKHPDFKHYGGRGIGVCGRWQRSFEGFLKDVGDRPSPKHSLDRIDNDADYGPGNVRWATRSQQMRNTHTNRIVVFRGRSMPIIEACEKAGLNYDAVLMRLRRKWPLARALSTPVAKRRSRDPADPTFLPKYIHRVRRPYNPFRVSTYINGQQVHVGCAPTLEAAVAMQKRALKKALRGTRGGGRRKQ